MAIYPIKRVVVYNSMKATTYITWEMHRNMEDPGPYMFQLQVARSPDENADWQDVGEPQKNVFYMTDAGTPMYGMRLDKYYRIKLTTSRGTYLSDPEGCFGQLTGVEWKLVRELYRKEILRFRYVGQPCLVLQRKTYGQKCPACTVAGGGSDNPDCLFCFGTGYLGGYLTPAKMLAEITPTRLKEITTTDNVTTFNTAVGKYQARALGIPEFYSGDILVDLATDQRFTITSSTWIYQKHRVPICQQLDMELLPVSDIAYNIPVGKPGEEELPVGIIKEGCGVFPLNQDYTGTDVLQYVFADGSPVVGATIKVFNEDGELVFITKTTVTGRWSESYLINPGKYTIVFEKPGVTNPSTVEIELTEDELTTEQKNALQQEEDYKSRDYTRPFGEF